MSKKYENFIISGFGYSLGKYRIDNDIIANAVDNGFLSGFNAERILNSEEYKNELQEVPDLHPFTFMAEYLMGFRSRYHVVPFPPIKSNYKYAENSLDLCVKATDQALKDAGVHPEEINAWLVSTATPHEQAPGLAETLKGYFTSFENKTECMTLTSACVGFNYNIERALFYFKANPKTKHLLVAHSEVMSELLVNERDFVPFVTFGDSAAAVVISRIEGDEKQGFIDVENGEDLQMIDFLGANRKGDLYMNPRMVKRRAVPNITNIAENLAQKMGIKASDADWFIPHQTGNAIVGEVAQNLEIIPCKLFQEVQFSYGNLSGASVPVAMARLQETDRLKPRQKIITAVAGLGGEFGGFSYIVPDFQKFTNNKLDLDGKTALLTGSTGGLGSEIAQQLAKRGANLILHYNSEGKRLESLKKSLSKYQVKTKFIQADFSDENSVKQLAETIINTHKSIDFIIHTAAISGKVERASNVSDEEMRTALQVNAKSPILLNEMLSNLVKECVLFTGSVAEDAQFSGSAAYVASKRALHTYAVGYAAQAFEKKVRCIYYMPAIIDGGMGDLLDNAQKAHAMSQIKQVELINIEEIAERMTKALFLPKLINTKNIYEGRLKVIKDGYFEY